LGWVARIWRAARDQCAVRRRTGEARLRLGKYLNQKEPNANKKNNNVESGHPEKYAGVWAVCRQQNPAHDGNDLKQSQSPSQLPHVKIAEKIPHGHRNLTSYITPRTTTREKKYPKKNRLKNKQPKIHEDSKQLHTGSGGELGGGEKKKANTARVAREVSG